MLGAPAIKYYEKLEDERYEFQAGWTLVSELGTSRIVKYVYETQRMRLI